MNERPFFSICIPCFNHANYVGKTIRSVLEQDFADFEIVIADNASTDDSRAVIKSFGDPRIRLIENRYNIGFAPNLQRVTQYARGRYINLVSSDDLMNAGALRSYADLIAQHPQESAQLVLMSQALEIDGHDCITRYVDKNQGSLAPKFRDMPGADEILQAPYSETHRGRAVFAQCMRDFTTAGVFCSVVYARELWESVEGYNSTQQFNPDKHFILKLMRTDPTVIFVNRPLYSYRRHQLGQAGQSQRAKVLRFQIDQYSYLLQFDEQWLEGTGVTPEHQRKLFINRDCLDHALVAAAEGDWTFATRLLAFAWSAYPATVIRQRKAWALFAMLAIGPLGKACARLFRSIYRINRSRKTAAPSVIQPRLDRQYRLSGAAGE